MAETGEGKEDGMERGKEGGMEGIFRRRRLQVHRPLECLRREAKAKTKGKSTWREGGRSKKGEGGGKIGEANRTIF